MSTGNLLGAFRTPVALLLVVVGLAAISIANEHFVHQLQPRGNGSSIPGYDHIAGPTLAELPKSEFLRQSEEAPLAYVSRMTQLVHVSTYHCEPTDHNLSLVQTVTEKVMIRTGRDPQRELGIISRERLRCGFCSERAIVLAGILRENGLDASVQGLAGHVTAMVVIDGVEYLADPDYGVGPFPYDLPENDLQDVYLASSLPGLAYAVVPLILDRADDAPYYSAEVFDYLTKLRTVLFRGSNAIALVLALVGMALLVVAAFFSKAKRPLAIYPRP